MAKHQQQSDTAWSSHNAFQPFHIFHGIASWFWQPDISSYRLPELGSPEFEPLE
jgi:hypothetical protein